MGIALTLQQYLDDRHVDYDTLVHRFSDTAMENAESAHVPGDRLVKAVVMKDENGYVMAVLPATRHIDIPTLKLVLDRDVALVDEEELKTLFEDCEIGAIPPVGVAYGLQTIVEDMVVNSGDLYFEAGDHTTLVHMQADAFEQVLGSASHNRFSFLD